MTPWETCHSGTASTICLGICLPEVVPPNYLGGGVRKKPGNHHIPLPPTTEGFCCPTGPSEQMDHRSTPGVGREGGGGAWLHINSMSFYFIFVIRSYVAQARLKLNICRGRSQSLTLPSAGLTGPGHLVLRWNRGIMHARQARYPLCQMSYISGSFSHGSRGWPDIHSVTQAVFKCSAIFQLVTRAIRVCLLFEKNFVESRCVCVCVRARTRACVCCSGQVARAEVRGQYSVDPFLPCGTWELNSNPRPRWQFTH